MRLRHLAAGAGQQDCPIVFVPPQFFRDDRQQVIDGYDPRFGKIGDIFFRHRL